MKRGSAEGFLPASAGQEHHFGSRCPLTWCPWHPAWGPAPPGKAGLCQAAPSPAVSPAVPRGHRCQPQAGEQDCKSVNILFILSITLLHYSLFNPLLFYY